ncbi:hypothetical protein [Parapontixanthobacter aurantiacus]|uniref:hypothetical protein n=1 Tax=Parapontixanthobacter aurantiacus TaxID=1463599 RepID=UPI001F306F00|nr:hypothetical protein [Parapontixanthobacter aurantiacus]
MKTIVQLFAAILFAMFAAGAQAQSERQVAQGSEPYVFQVDTLQNGGSAGETLLDLDTPLGLMETFMDAG